MNRDKIVEIATALPREAYIDLLCAGANVIYCEYRWSTSWPDKYPNISKNQAVTLGAAYKEGKEEEDE